MRHYLAALQQITLVELRITLVDLRISRSQIEDSAAVIIPSAAAIHMLLESSPRTYYDHFLSH